MTSYYNENDPFAAAWLRELINAGQIAPGIVDERSIEDVTPADLAGFTQCHWFAGIGGWSLALRLAGWSDDRRIWTGSCPCQPFSAAGKGGGNADERHLWPAFFHLITQCRPDVIFGEQVASIDGLGWLDGVRTDLENADYSVGSVDICAAGVGAPHIRQRLYWVGDAQREGLEGHEGDGHAARGAQATGPNPSTGCGGAEPSRLDALSLLRGMDVHSPRDARSRVRLPSDGGMGDRSIWSEFEALACSDGWRRVRPGAFPMAYGVPVRLGRLRGYGNAIVPQVAAEVIRAYMR